MIAQTDHESFISDAQNPSSFSQIIIRIIRSEQVKLNQKQRSKTKKVDDIQKISELFTIK